MKEIKAIIQPFLADKVLDALREMPQVPGVTISEVRGFGRGRATDDEGQAKEAEIFGVKKVKVEIVVVDDLLDQVLEAILRHAHTGNPGDGKIFISEVTDVVKVRTGEHGETAI